MEVLGLWLSSDPCDEGFGACIHVDVALDWLGGFFIYKIVVFVCMPFNVAKDEGDRAGAHEVCHFHFEVNVALSHGSVCCL